MANKIEKLGDWEYSSGAEHLFSMFEALGSIPGMGRKRSKLSGLSWVVEDLMNMSGVLSLIPGTLK